MPTITGSYSNYLTMSSLLSSMGSQSSSDSIQQALSAAVSRLQNNSNAKAFQSNALDTLTQLQSNSADLAGTASALSSDSMSSVFNDRTATSSNKGVVNASAYSSLGKGTGASVAKYALEVNNLAKAQNNSGNELKASDSSTMNVGTNTFTINVNGTSNQISFDVEDSDTNDDVLTKMADAINNADIGVSAAVNTGKTAGTEQFSLTADTTGASQAFTLSDVSGNAVQASGADKVAQAAQDAAYMLNGTSYTSASNTIALDEGMVKATLQGTGSASLSVAPDAGKVQNAIKALVSGINTFRDAVGNNSSYINGDVLSPLNTFLSDHKNDLGALGITEGEDGKLSIDTAKLASAVTQKMTSGQSSFAGIEGLADEINNYTSQISQNNPANYAKTMANSNNSPYSYLGTGQTVANQMLAGSLLNLYT